MQTKDKLTVDSSFIRRILREMVKINSVLGNEETLALYLADELEKLGISPVIEYVDGTRPNLYGSHTFSSEGKTLTYNGHLDTVDVCKGWLGDPFQPREKEQRLIGLGAVDMKAGLACQLAALKALIDSGEELQGTIHYTAVMDEEGYGKGGKAMLQNKEFGKGRTDGVVISEPFHGLSQKNGLPLGMTGKVLYKILVKGKSAHAFRPDEGINAVTDGARILTKLTEAVKDEGSNLFSLPKDADFGEGNLCVLKIDGGYKIYSVVVPDTCEIILNRLIIPGETKESVKKDMSEFISRLELESTVTIEIVEPYYYSYKLSIEHDLVQSITHAFTQEYNKKPYYSYGRMITDANTFMGEGTIPTILFGPRGGNLHAAEEYVELPSLTPTANIYVKLFLEFQKKKE